MQYALVEKQNRLALHGIFSTKESAEQHLRETIPIYVAKSYFVDKTLTADSFEIVEWAPQTPRRKLKKGH